MGARAQSSTPLLVCTVNEVDVTNNTVDNLVIFITAKTISAEGAPVEQVFNSEEIRQFHMKRSDLPGYRDGSDPFIDESPDAAKGHSN